MEKERYLITVCAICVYRIRDKDGNWVFIDIDLTNEKDTLLVSHGYCPECAEEVRQEIKAKRSSK